MLQMIRDRSQGLIVGVIVFLICLTFALFGIQQYLDASSNVVVGEVNGEEIELREFQRSFQQLRQRAQTILGEEFDPTHWSSAETKLSTLDYLVEERMLLQLVDDANLRASDAQVAEFIRTSPQFQQDGEFSKELYERAVQVLGFSEIGFEDQVRKDIVLNQLRAGVGASSFATAEELQRLERYRQQTRDVGYAIIGIEAFKPTEDPSSEDLDAYFQENVESYRIPEKISLAYVELSIESLMGGIDSADEQLRAYYDNNTANYSVQEQRNANHILISVAKEATDEEVEAAREKAMQLREDALAGKAFEDLARDNSDDIGSRTEGGETGFFGKGVMAPEFEAAVFSMTDGDISEPIRTDFGFHIIRLKETKPGGIKTFEEVRDVVRDTYAREQAEALYFDQAEQLSELSYEQPDSLEPLVDALGMVIKTTDLSTRSELAELLSPRIIDVAFEPEVLVEGLNSEPVEIADGRVIVIRVLEHVASRVPTLEEVRNDVVVDLNERTAREAIADYGQSLIERLAGGEDIETLASAESLNWEALSSVSRESQKLNRAILRAAFRADATQDGAVFEGVPLGTGDFAIVQIANVSLPEVEQLNVSDIGQLRRDVASQRTASTWQDFISVVKSTARVQTFPDRL